MRKVNRESIEAEGGARDEKTQRICLREAGGWSAGGELTYLAVLLLLKGLKSLAGIMKPFAQLLPRWLPADQVLSLLLVLVGCFLIGAALRTRVGYGLWNRLEKAFFERMPGYALIRSLTQRLAGVDREAAWKPALVEVEEALVPAFIIEELGDGRFTVFVPLIPTPLSGSGLHPDGGTGASVKCAVHAGNQNHFALGV